MNSKISQKDNSFYYYITTDYDFIFYNSDANDIELIVSKLKKTYQNYTNYEYFQVICSSGKITNENYTVTSYEKIEKHINSNSKKQSVFSFLFWCIVDAVLDGGGLSLLLGWAIGVKAGLICFLVFCVFSIVMNLIMRRADKSRHRIFNWVKDGAFTDDILYLIKHINKFCKTV